MRYLVMAAAMGMFFSAGLWAQEEVPETPEVPEVPEAVEPSEPAEEPDPLLEESVDFAVYLVGSRDVGSR